MPNPTRVLPFPRPHPEGVRTAEPLIAWWRCEGKCGALVASAGAYCLRCTLEDTDNG